jgi:hypothetical protein
MTMPIKKCSVDGCTRPALSKTGLGLCNACYQGLHYWMRKRSVRKIIARAQQLHVWSVRMEMLMGKKKVVPISTARVTRRKRRKAA